MAYISTIQQRTYTIDPQANGQQRNVTIDEQAYRVDWRQIAPLAASAKGQTTAGGQFSLLIAGKSYDIFARDITKANQQASKTYEIFVAGQRFEVNVEDERTRTLEGLTSTGIHSGLATVEAPMPGLVVNVTVEAGTSVSAGQTVVILEAMKMENDLASPITGTIKEVQVNTGQTVDQGQTLVTIEGTTE
jgi:biotin carboxyl carrier protein